MWLYGGSSSHKASDFHIGDRVRALGYNWAYVEKGDTGTVIFVASEANIGIQWDRCIYGHSCGDRGLRRYCTWERPCNIETIEEVSADEEDDSLILQDCEDLI